MSALNSNPSHEFYSHSVTMATPKESLFGKSERTHWSGDEPDGAKAEGFGFLYKNL